MEHRFISYIHQLSYHLLQFSTLSLGCCMSPGKSCRLHSMTLRLDTIDVCPKSLGCQDSKLGMFWGQWTSGVWLLHLLMLKLWSLDVQVEDSRGFLCLSIITLLQFNSKGYFHVKIQVVRVYEHGHLVQIFISILYFCKQ